eukprot:6724662-Prorocentrum_lima.AAC.1
MCIRDRRCTSAPPPRPPGPPPSAMWNPAPMPGPPREGLQLRNLSTEPVRYAEDDFLSQAWDTRLG